MSVNHDVRNCNCFTYILVETYWLTLITLTYSTQASWASLPVDSLFSLVGNLLYNFTCLIFVQMQMLTLCSYKSCCFCAFTDVIQSRVHEAAVILRNAIDSSQPFPYWHCRLIFQLAVSTDYGCTGCLVVSSSGRISGHALLCGSGSGSSSWQSKKNG